MRPIFLQLADREHLALFSSDNLYFEDSSILPVYIDKLSEGNKHLGLYSGVQRGMEVRMVYWQYES